MTNYLDDILALYAFKELMQRVTWEPGINADVRGVSYRRVDELIDDVNERIFLDSEASDIPLVSKYEMERALLRLDEIGWLERVEHPLTEERLAATEVGEDAFRAGSGELDVLPIYLKLGADWLLEALVAARQQATEGKKPTSFGFAPDNAGFDQAPFQSNDSKIPAADRHVLASDNQEAIGEAQQALSALQRAVEDNRDNDFENKEEVLCDLAVLEATFSQPLINTTLVESIFSTTISYLTIKFADNAIGIASNALILATAKFIGLVG